MSATPRKRIVVVEDDAVLRELMVDLLHVLGHHVALATDLGSLGAQHLITQNVDLGLIDLTLHDLDGYEVARRVREAGRSVRLIAISGLSEASAQVHAERAGFDAYLRKPHTLDQLAAAIDASNRLARAGIIEDPPS